MVFIPKVSLIGISQDHKWGFLKDTTGSFGAECDGIVNQTGYSNTLTNPPKNSFKRILFGERRLNGNITPLVIEDTTDAGADFRVSLTGDAGYYIYMGLLPIYVEANEDDYLEGQYLWDNTAGIAVQWVAGATVPQVSPVPVQGYFALATLITPVLASARIAYMNFMNKYASELDCDCADGYYRKANKLKNYMRSVCELFALGDDLQGQKFIHMTANIIKD